ncbi:Transcriptional regulator LytR [bioreactor metagenome]|jgi:polyisoprenyl-teichoic acid--peptidoglycan teichoic acid transferase|uniref:Transcriptional regulator LytR n=1 Tax=bioreactor metagenome TaxID=1076179 RepID=A0A644WC61_9ZZZZ
MGNRREDLESVERKRPSREEQIKRRKIEARKRKKKRQRRRIAISILTVLLVAILGTALYIYNFLSGLKTNTLGTGVAPISSQDPINILVLGMDIGDVDNQGNKSGRRSDTIMVLNYNPNTKKVHVVSIPRDTLVEIDAYLDSGEYRRYWKINTAYVLGGEEEIKTHVEDLLGINLNYIVEVDYTAFRSIVDALGGIEMKIEQDMFYDDDEQNLHINFKAGETVLLDGKKAEEFFRWRKNNDGSGGDEGDLGRINNQHQFISKVINKALSPSIVFKAPKILEAISQNVDTNIPAKNLISLGMKIMRLKPADIIMTTLQGEPEYIYGESFLIADKETNRELINALNAESTSSAPIITSVNREELKVLVLNGTKIDGLASSARDTLLSLGYTNIEVGNTDNIEKSVIETDNKDLKDLLKNDIGIEKSGKISKSEYKEYDAVIVLGKDYNLFGN